MKVRIILLLAFLVYSCHQNRENAKHKGKASAEVEALFSLEDRETYLLFLFEEDQKMRQGESADIILKYGMQSSEMKDFTQRSMALDALNLSRVETYLNKFGYPDHSKHSDLANAAIPAVIHHSNSYKDREHFLPSLISAYNEDLVTLDPILMILNRMHRMKFGKHLEWNDKFRPEEEMERLSKALDLDLHLKS